MIHGIANILVVCSLAPAAPTVDQVIARHEQAAGVRVQTLVRKGYVLHGSAKVPFEWTWHRPGQWHGIAGWRRGPVAVFFDGAKGFRKDGGTAAQQLTRDEVLMESILHDVRLVSNLKRMFASLSPVRIETRAGRPVHVLTARRAENADERILPSDPEIVFDASTGLLLQFGPVRFEDYREVAGAMLAHRISFGGDHMTYTVTEARPNVPVDAGLFQVR